MHHHNYKVIGDNNEATVEICIECKKQLITKKDNKGRIDSKAYLREHIRDTAQPNGPTAKIFDKYYGNNQTTKGRR